MNHKTPPGYGKKFADFIKMCSDLKVKGVKEIIAANPVALGDNHEEVIDSLSRLAEAGLALHVASIASRSEPPGRN